MQTSVCSLHSNMTFSDIRVCWPLPNNQSLYRQIGGYGMGVGDHRVG